MSSSPNAPSSLRQQLLVWLLVPLLLLLVVNSFLSYRAAIATANQAYDRLLLASVKAIADRVTVYNGEITVDIPYVALELFESNIHERIFYKVTGPNGATLTGYEDLPPPPLHPEAQGRPIFFRSEYHGESLYQAALYKQLYDPTFHGTVLVQVGETAESREALSRRILYDGLVRQGLLIVLAALLLWLSMRFVLRPLLRLRDSIAGRSSTDLTPVDDSGIQSEVRPLIQAINQHTERIEKMTAARLRFLADAAHQVRTRMTILKTQVEYGRRLDEPQALHGVLEDAQAIVDETTHLFNQLLVLAQAESNAGPRADTQDLDFAAQVHAITLEWVTEARRKHILLAFEGPDSDESVRGNALLLRELVSNLLDNAIRYTPRGGSVTARIQRDGEWIALEVEDNGPGVPEAERERVFERFYRAPGSDVEGSGLGLAIAREICRAHGAIIELLTPASGDGLLIRVRMRAVPAAVNSAKSLAASVL